MENKVNEITSSKLNKIAKNKEIKKAVVTLSVLFLTGFIINLIIKMQNNRILQHGRRTSAYILTVEMQIKPYVPSVKYYYKVNDDTFIFTYYFDNRVNFKKLKMLEGKTLPVIYDTTNIKKSVLMINEADYK